MLEVNDKAVFKLSSDYALSSLESNNSKFWLFELKEGNIYRLNDVSHFMLSLLDGRKDFATIVDAVTLNYEGVDKNEIKRDGQEFLSRCLSKGIIYRMEEDGNEKV